jgi:hypothetical protein
VAASTAGARQWQKRRCSQSFGQMLRVVLLVLEGAVLFDIGTVQTVLGAKRPGSGRPELPYTLTLATTRPGLVQTASGIALCRSTRASRRSQAPTS